MNIYEYLQIFTNILSILSNTNKSTEYYTNLFFYKRILHNIIDKLKSNETICL